MHAYPSFRCRLTAHAAMWVPWSRYRTSHMHPWTWLNPGESVALGPPQAKVSLDYNDPDSCVFKIVKRDPDEPRFSVAAKRNLPSGWITGIDQASGTIYFQNELTGQSQWEPPL